MIKPPVLKINSDDKEIIEQYIPPIAGNGELCYLVDYTGGQLQKSYPGGYFDMYPTIWWAGKRYDNHQYSLVPFGHFENLNLCEKNSKIAFWEQELEPEKGIITSRIKTDGKTEEENIIFSPFEERMIVIHKTTKAQDGGHKKIGLRFVLSPPNEKNKLPDKMKINPEIDENLINIAYSIDGYKQYTGNILIYATKNVKITHNKNKFDLVFHINDNLKTDDITFYLLFHCTEDKKSLKKKAEHLKACKFDSVLNRYIKDWSSFHNKGFVNLPDKRLQKQWKTSLYHLMISSTKWSVPTGILNTHWNGRYFYDEFYSFLALLSSGHWELSKKIPVFRKNTLEKALYRTWNNGAHYAWESIEDGNDGIPHGASLNEVHHCGMIALECWLQYYYTNDKNFLKKIAYPVIKQTAEFYRKWLVIELENDTAIIQKCVDIDESDVPVLNPLYTACSVISNFRIATQAAKILETDEDLIPVWRDCARKLENNLPIGDTKFIPFEGSVYTHIGVLGILHPFGIFSHNNETVKNTIYDFMKRAKNRCGYSAGISKFYKNQSWTWASGLLTTCLNLLHDSEHAYTTLLACLKPVGTFGCMCEHYKYMKKIFTVPWFSTASGVFIYALNSMLIQSDAHSIRLFPAIPVNWDDLEFKLMVKGNIILHARLKDGLLRYLSLNDVSSKRKRIEHSIILDKKYYNHDLKSEDGIFSFIAHKEDIIINVRFEQSMIIN